MYCSIDEAWSNKYRKNIKNTNMNNRTFNNLNNNIENYNNTNHIREDNIREDNIREDNIREDNIREDNIREDNIREDNIRKNNIRKNNIKEDNINENILLSKQNKIIGLKNNNIEHFDNDNKYQCNDLVLHLNNCTNCQKNIGALLKKDKFLDLFNVTPEIKEIIIIFLIGIVLLLILNMFYK